MLRLVNSENNRLIYFNDILLFKNNFIRIGQGTASYEMKNGGVFKHRNRLNWLEEIQLSIYSETESGISIKGRINHLDEDIIINIDVIDNLLKITFNKILDINRLYIKMESLENDYIYGCGETFTEFNLRRQSVRIWVAEHQNLKRMISKLIDRKVLRRSDNHISSFRKYDSYYVQPTFISSQKYFCHVDTTNYCNFDFRNKHYHMLEIRDLPKQITFGFNDNYESLLTTLTNLLGRQPKLPKWAYQGTILGIQGGKDVLLKKIENASNHNIKVTGVWCQDWEGIRITKFGKQLMWNWEYDNELYPNLPELIKNLNSKNIKFLGYINPFLAIEGNLYKHASSKGYCVKNKEGNDYMVTITTFPAAMLDLTNPDAVRWIKKIIKENMIDIGISGWMADFGEYLPTDAILYSNVEAEQIHNEWPAMWAKINYDVIKECGKENEIFFFTRAGYTETIKYSPMMWNGDQHVNFSIDDGLPSVITATLSLSMSGFGICHSDLGGYTTIFDMKRDKDLFIRWCELSTFSPMMRGHEGNRPIDNVQFDDDLDCLNIYSRMSNIFNQLNPYIDCLINENSTKGIPVMRPLFMYYDEKEAYETKYQYLLGRDILVAPIITKNTFEQEVYLPNDNWIHMWTHKTYCGGRYRIRSEYGYPPVFFRKDSEMYQLFNLLK